MKRTFLFVLIITLLQACSFSEKDVVGVYTRHPSTNNIDSLFVYANKQYKQKFYGVWGDLMYENQGEWLIDSGKYIKFRRFYLDFDHNQESRFFHEDDVMTCWLPLSRGKIIVNYDTHIYYTKVQ